MELLPPLYAMANFTECKLKGDLFCKVSGSLISMTRDNEVWRQIKQIKADPLDFDRSLLHRALCVPKNFSYNEKSIMQYSDMMINKEIRNLSLTIKSFYVNCVNNELRLQFYDCAILFGIVSYVLLLLGISIYDNSTKTKKDRNGLIWKFSYIYNWKQVVKPKNNRDYERLKCIQGIRFCLMLSVITSHTFLSIILNYKQDVVDMKKGAAFSGVFVTIFAPIIVQPFFLISNWLCTLQIYNIFEDKGKVTMRDLLILILNRYFRIAVTLTVVVLIISMEWTELVATQISPNTFNLMQTLTKACRNNMLPTLFFFNNHQNFEDMCYPATWYLSADFQYYIITATILYVTLNFRLNVLKVLSSFFVLSCVLYGIIIYVNGLGHMYRSNCRSFEFVHLMTSFEYIMLYSSTFSSLPTAIVGMFYGVFYVRTRHIKDLNKNKILVAVWYVIVITILTISLVNVDKDYKGLPAALIGPLVKPLLASAIGLAIFGMSHNMGGPIKRLLECRIAEIMGNFVYATYCSHCLIVFCRFFLTEGLPDSSYNLVYEILFDYVISIPLGIFTSLFLEQPGLTMQKIFLPQVKTLSTTRNIGDVTSNSDTLKIKKRY